jgi:hypothetical protein
MNLHNHPLPFARGELERDFNKVIKGVREKMVKQKSHYVEIPVYNLMLLHKDEYKLLGITLRRATSIDASHYNTDFMGVGLTSSDVHSFACLQVELDEAISIYNSGAITKVRNFFEMVRAFCFPFGKNSDAWNTGIFGDIPLRSSIPMIIDKGQYHFKSIQNNQQIEFETHILPKLSSEQWGLLNLITKQKAKRLSDGIHWLAEATKPDTNNAKFIKISIALETLLGLEPNDDNLKVRSITAMLAERAAFIISNDCDKMCVIDKRVRYLYGKRSEIVHGKGEERTLDEVDEFGNLVREIALAIIEEKYIKKELIEKRDKLEEWIRKKKYTLPTNKEATYVSTSG